MSIPDNPMTGTIQRAIEGNTDAVTALYQTHAEAIYRYIAYRVPTETDAEDLTADVFLKMVEGLSDYRITGAPFEAWLYRIASARVADFHRRAARRPQIEISDSEADSDPLPEEQLEYGQELDTLKDALQQLSDEQQNVLILRFVEHKSHKEVADLMGKSVTAVKSIQHRALTRLSQLLGADDKARHYLRGTHG